MSRMARKPISLDDLDREELLALARRHCLCTQRDLVLAQHEVASRRYLAALDESHAAWERWLAAAGARSEAFKAGNDRAIITAMQADVAAEVARDRAEAKVRRLEARKERLDRLYEELPR